MEWSRKGSTWGAGSGGRRAGRRRGPGRRGRRARSSGGARARARPRGRSQGGGARRAPGGAGARAAGPHGWPRRMDWRAAGVFGPGPAGSRRRAPAHLRRAARQAGRRAALPRSRPHESRPRPAATTALAARREPTLPRGAYTVGVMAPAERPGGRVVSGPPGRRESGRRRSVASARFGGPFPPRPRPRAHLADLSRRVGGWREMATTASAGGARQWLGVAPCNRLGGESAWSPANQVTARHVEGLPRLYRRPSAAQTRQGARARQLGRRAARGEGRTSRARAPGAGGGARRRARQRPPPHRPAAASAGARGRAGGRVPPGAAR
jgi:hypothetical protein